MTPSTELQQRIKKFKKSMAENNIAGALLIQRADLFYFSGTGQNAHLFVPADGDPILIVKKSLIRAGQESALENIIPFRGWDSLARLIADTLPPGSKIGLELDVLPAKLFFRYQELLNDYNLTDISTIARGIRAVKSAYEIGLIGEAAKMSRSLFDYAGEIIREGMAEIELAGHLEMQARTLGHQGAVRMRSFNQEIHYGHVMAGDNASVVSFFDGPTGGPGVNPSYPQGAGTRKIKRGEPILVDLVSIFGGYMIDQTRIFSIGEPAVHLQEAYRQALEIKHVLMQESHPGITGGELFKKAEVAAADAGLANHFMGYTEKVQFIGHGVGIELDEMPIIGRGVEQKLEEGMVFALEPKFIFPGEGTVGIEDTFTVEKNGLRQLTLSDDRLQII
ncbi:MAG TPA: aminopeptidase P family protein [Firmicutes bacterium]|nr:aminopeptidase P family protein [Bacillota bacterium]